MYRGYYTLDSFRTQANRADLGVSHTFALSKFNPAKRLFLSIADTNDDKLQQVVNNLSNIIVDVSDFHRISEELSSLVPATLQHAPAS